MLHLPKIRVGDVLESAIWLTGEETPALVEHHKAQVEAAILDQNAQTGAVTGPMRWTEKLPGDDRVPPVPDHIQGICVRLLVGEAEVLNVMGSESRFLAELEPSDLKRLRKITKRAHKSWWLRTFPGVRYEGITDRQADTLINDLGPEAGLEAMRKGWTRLATGDAETMH